MCSCVCPQVYVKACTSVYVYVCTFTLIYTYTCVKMCVCVSMDVRVCTCERVYMYVYILFICLYTHTRMYTCVCVCVCARVCRNARQGSSCSLMWLFFSISYCNSSARTCGVSFAVWTKLVLLLQTKYDGDATVLTFNTLYGLVSGNGGSGCDSLYFESRLLASHNRDPRNSRLSSAKSRDSKPESSA